MKANLGTWFEIPVHDMDRAKAFYERVFGVNIHVVQFGETQMGWFPSAEDPEAAGAGGSLVHNPAHYKPSADGTLIYLSSEDISTELDRVEAAGGKVLQGKTQISEEIGYMAVFMDTEGNRVAMHSRS